MRKELRTGKYLSLFKTDLGFGGVVAGDNGLVEVFLPFLEKNPDKLSNRVRQIHPAAVEEGPLSGKACRLLEKYFVGKVVDFDLPIDMSGFTIFQSAVYEAVSLIPYGEVWSYKEVADKIGRPGSARAVGGAMADNPLPVIIPCHRVVGASGKLTGYSASGGIDSKQWLLEMESATKGRTTTR